MVDSRAYGGLAGAGVSILERMGHHVSVTGIADHELPGLDLVTCAALLHTNHHTLLSSLFMNMHTMAEAMLFLLLAKLNGSTTM